MKWWNKVALWLFWSPLSFRCLQLFKGKHSVPRQFSINFIKPKAQTETTHKFKTSLNYLWSFSVFSRKTYIWLKTYIFSQLSHFKTWKIQKSDSIVISISSSIILDLTQLRCHKKSHPRCCYPQFPLPYTPMHSNNPPLAPTSWKAYVWHTHCFLSLLR